MAEEADPVSGLPVGEHRNTGTVDDVVFARITRLLEQFRYLDVHLLSVGLERTPWMAN